MNSVKAISTYQPISGMDIGHYKDISERIERMSDNSVNTEHNYFYVLRLMQEVWVRSKVCIGNDILNLKKYFTSTNVIVSYHSKRASKLWTKKRAIPMSGFKVSRKAKTLNRIKCSKYTADSVCGISNTLIGAKRRRGL